LVHVPQLVPDLIARLAAAPADGALPWQAIFRIIFRPGREGV
jgi:hypothetical protein